MDNRNKTTECEKVRLLSRGVAVACCAALLGTGLALAEEHKEEHNSVLDRLNHNDKIASTVPDNGDVNPYGVAIVPRTTGALVRGNVLISNFNNAANLQGTGTTIVQVSPDGDVRLFSQLSAADLPGPCPGGVGLTTALAVLRSGWVVVGSLPTSDGTAATARAGCLIVLNNMGKPVETLSGDDINGPWDMTAVEFEERAALFVTNVLNGTVAAEGRNVPSGTVLRIVLNVPDAEDGGMPAESSRTVIASGFNARTDPAALVIGPTGLGLGHEGKLYVADTAASSVDTIPDALFRMTDAGTGATLSSGGALNGPLGLAVTANGHILVTNAGDGNMVEIEPKHGSQVAVKAVDSTGAGGGTLFGLAVAGERGAVYFVNDGNNTLNLLHGK
jgi:hypothetical protein